VWVTKRQKKKELEKSGILLNKKLNKTSVILFTLSATQGRQTMYN
jgi:hypothetical protein